MIYIQYCYCIKSLIYVFVYHLNFNDEQILKFESSRIIKPCSCVTIILNVFSNFFFLWINSLRISSLKGTEEQRSTTQSLFHSNVARSLYFHSKTTNTKATHAHVLTFDREFAVVVPWNSDMGDLFIRGALTTVPLRQSPFNNDHRRIRVRWSKELSRRW